MYTSESNPGVRGYGRARARARALTTIAASECFLQTSSFASDPLAGHGGSGNNLFLRWNALDSDISAVDVIVHLHGYTSSEATESMLQRRVSLAGLDLSTRSRATLAIVARGRKITREELERERAAAIERANRTGREPRLPNPARYTFPGLAQGSGAGLEELVGLALAWWSEQVLGRTNSSPAIDRLVFTAHSGGGAALNGLLRHRDARRICNPHEVHVFDGLYFDGSVMRDGIEGWLRARIAGDLAAGGGALRSDMAMQGGGMRVFFGPSTQGNASWLRTQLSGSDLVGGAAGVLAPWYRVEDGGSDHDGMPNRLGPRLLADVAAEVVTTATGQAFGRARAYGTPVGLFQHFARAPRADARPFASPAVGVQVLPRRSFATRGAFALVDQNSGQAEQSLEVRRNIARSVGQAEASGRFDLVHDDSGRVNFGIGSWTGARIAGVLDVVLEVADEQGITDRLHGYFGGQAAFDALRQRFRTQGTAATASASERAALRSVGQDTALQEAQVRRLADDVQVDLDSIGHEGNPWYPWIDSGMGAISELAAHVLVHARHQAGAGGFRTVLTQAIDHFGGEAALGQAMVDGSVTERDFLTEVGERIVARVQAPLRAGVRARYTTLLTNHSGSVLSYYFDPAN